MLAIKMMKFGLRRIVGSALRIVIAVACLAGIWSSLKLARADYLFRKDTSQSIWSALQLEPDAWAYYMRLAQLDPPHAQELLATSLRLNRYDAQADIELGLSDEANGGLSVAEKHLLDAYSVDHTYVPRWSLANFYFRRGNMPLFWRWARSAASMPADDIGALFELCWRASPDPKTLTAQLVNEKPEMLRQYIRFLLEMDQADAAAPVVPRLMRAGDRESDQAMLFTVIGQMIGHGNGIAANELWQSMIAQKWVVADATVPNNADFQREPAPVGFDWWLPEYPGLHSWPGSSGLETEFSGSEPENCVIAAQTVYLPPGKYRLDYSYRTSGIPERTGIRWQVLDVKSKTELAESKDLSSDQLAHIGVAFSVPQGSTLVQVRLAYNRALGTTRVTGSLDIVSTQIGNAQ